MQALTYSESPLLYHEVGTYPPADEIAGLRDAVARTLEAKPFELTVGLDRIESLDAGLLSALIAGLRRVREQGGSIRLHVVRADLLRTLEVTGLNRVFEVVSQRPQPPQPAVEKDGKKSRARRVAGGIVAGVMMLAAAAIPGVAQTPEPSAEQIVAKIVERNPALTSFQAHVDVRLHTGIPFLNPTLEGTTYFKRPDNYEVVFTKVPSYAKGIDKLYSDIGDPSSWGKRYEMTPLGEVSVDGHRDLGLRLVQRVRGMIDHEDVAIDPQRWVVERMNYYYYNGGTIQLDQTFREESGFTVLSDQRASIALPHIPRVTGMAHYSAYHVNVAIDDSVFTLRQTKDLGTK